MDRLDVHVVALEGDLETAVRALEERFGMPRNAAERFFRKLPRVARHHVDLLEARAYQRVLAGLGARVELRAAVSMVPPSGSAGDLPSLPVPAHGPTGVTPSMQAFASSARLANRVPRAPALPLDLTNVERLDIDFYDPDQVELVLKRSSADTATSTATSASTSKPTSKPTSMESFANLSSDPTGDDAWDSAGSAPELSSLPAELRSPDVAQEATPRSDTPTTPASRAPAPHAQRRGRAWLWLLGIAVLVVLAASWLSL